MSVKNDSSRRLVGTFQSTPTLVDTADELYLPPLDRLFYYRYVCSMPCLDISTDTCDNLEIEGFCASRRLRAEEVLHRVAQAATQGKIGAAHRFAREYLRLDAAKVVAAWKSGLRCTSPAGLSNAATEVNPYSAHPEPIQWRWVTKSSGAGVRPICVLPWRLKATHLLVRDVLTARLRPGPHLYCVKGRGRDRQAIDVQEALEQGRVWCFVGDLKDCFQSVRAEALYELLPLPARVVECSLDYRSLSFAYGDSTSVSRPTGAKWDGPRGLLQGSPTSNIVLASLFNELPELPRDCAVFLYSDNILVASHSERECREIGQTLVAYFDAHRAGPFILKGASFHVDEMSDADNTTTYDPSFENLGLSYSKQSGRVVVEPSHSGFERIFAHLLWALAEDLESPFHEPAHALQALHTRLSAYRPWTREEREMFVEVQTEEIHSWFSGQFRSDPPIDLHHWRSDYERIRKRRGGKSKPRKAWVFD